MLKHLNASPRNPARVVVVGANGFVGGAVAHRLEEAGIETVRVGRKEVDLLTPDAADRLSGYLNPSSALVAVSAIAPVRNAPMLSENVTLALAIATAAANAEVDHVVNIGSDALYSDSHSPLNENSLTSPDNLHGVMHFAREVMFKNAIKAPTAFVRPTLIYGARDPHNGYGPNRFRRLAAEGRPITLFGKGEERRDHVYVDDVADLVYRVLMNKSHGVINAVSGAVTSFREIADMVAALSGNAVAIDCIPRNGPMPHNGYRSFDPAAIHAAFPDFKITLLNEGLAVAQAEEKAG